MRIHCKFLISAANPGQFPATDVPEIAFLGRSNVGKSSLLNSLVGETIARVSSTPGRTRTINFFEIYQHAKRPEADLRLADLPGYGYAKLSKSITAEWPKFIDPYLKERAQLAGCVVLVDSNIPPQSSDGQLLEFLRSVRTSFLVVATKIDRLSGNKLYHSLNTLKRELGVASILPYSAKTGVGREKLWEAIREIMVKYSDRAT